MYLVDNEIKELIATKNIIENADETAIGAISCDLSIKYILADTGKDDKSEVYELEPGATVIVASNEILNMPDDMIAQVLPKNSRIRLGLRIDAPVYQPGHQHTRIFISVTNVSADVIELRANEQIAAVAFSRLSHKPTHTYAGGFQNEDTYKRLANYDSIWGMRIKRFDDKYKNIKDVEKRIYENVIMIMTVFIGIFSIINFEIGFMKDTAYDGVSMLIYNLIFVGGISALVAIINCILPYKEGSRSKLFLFIVPLVCFIWAAITVMCR